ncbi:MAG: HPr family phosphocarrier protein [Defluviitaleaceae bacterium]|nr:HPr family phosphocarrier protein [Defluviitaleaceae bacterium]MCL2836781.1 HPr family phosphocarrier protein [Defluviitaleaceae bacterium]
MISREFKTAINLEARMAALFVQNANKYTSRQQIRRDNMEVNCKSIMGVISMSIREGEFITITAAGADEAEAVDALVKMLAGV